MSNTGVMSLPRGSAVAGLLGQAVFVCAVDALTRPDAAGRAVTTAAMVVLDVAAAVGLRRAGVHRLGPADLVTLTRGTLACAIAGLVITRTVTSPRARTQPLARHTIGALSTAALVLDAVDGKVARRTDTVSAFGAKLDGETDAFLILALSIHATRAFGGWVAVGGLARYGFAAAGWILPWMRRPLPPRNWRKVATAAEGIALTAAAYSVPKPKARAGLVAGLVLIVESFGRDVAWLWHRRREPV